MSYIPERGDIVWIQMNPQAGREQAGHRPAFVVSPKVYNGKVGLALMCPITSKVKGYPFEVAVTAPGVTGVVLSDQVKCLDWGARGARFHAKAGRTTVGEVIARIESLIRL